MRATQSGEIVRATGTVASRTESAVAGTPWPTIPRRLLVAQRVVYLDDDGRRRIAESLGAETMPGPPRHKVGRFHITVDASDSGPGLRCALESTAFDGICTTDQEVPMFSMYSRCCTLHTRRAHARAAIPHALERVAAGFEPSAVTTDWSTSTTPKRLSPARP
jgi:hypothetical protein